MHLFALLSPPTDAAGGAALFQAVHCLTVKKFDSANEPSTGTAVALIASRVTEIHMSADETLLVAQQNHDLEVEK